jgi:hypothetical protein
MTGGESLTIIQDQLEKLKQLSPETVQKGKLIGNNFSQRLEKKTSNSESNAILALDLQLFLNFCRILVQLSCQSRSYAEYRH